MYAQYECQLMLSLSCAGVTRDSEMVVTAGRHNGDKCIFIHFHCECEYIWNNKPIILPKQIYHARQRPRLERHSKGTPE